jgi:hypothetical protein
MSSPKFLRILGQYVNVAHIKRIVPLLYEIHFHLIPDPPTWGLVLGGGGTFPDSFSELKVSQEEHPEEFARLNEEIKRLV